MIHYETSFIVNLWTNTSNNRIDLKKYNNAILKMTVVINAFILLKPIKISQQISYYVP